MLIIILVPFLLSIHNSILLLFWQNGGAVQELWRKCNVRILSQSNSLTDDDYASLNFVATNECDFVKLKTNKDKIYNHDEIFHNLLQEKAIDVEQVMANALKDEKKTITDLKQKLLTEKTKYIEAETNILLNYEQEKIQLLLNNLFNTQVTKMRSLIKRLYYDSIIEDKNIIDQIKNKNEFIDLINNMLYDDEIKHIVSEYLTSFLDQENPFEQYKIYKEIKNHIINEQKKNKQGSCINVEHMYKKYKKIKKVLYYKILKNGKTYFELAKHISYDVVFHNIMENHLGVFLLPITAVSIILFQHLLKKRRIKYA
ncbi:hypothetical protein HEP_00180200 [Hepatocystis sp. ex Piliocolobus tephrosceles]|nr:hypothetical protein HEP_00180200 [Hepatocystis sp. ex Piliocolobus tephrosceles]